MKTLKTVSEKTASENEVLAKIEAMAEPYRSMGQKLHTLIKANAPGLTPKTWYGMPAYAKNGKIICFFRSGEKFKERYMTLGFNNDAKLDDGNLWPVAFALTAFTDKEEKKIGALVKKAAN